MLLRWPIGAAQPALTRATTASRAGPSSKVKCVLLKITYLKCMPVRENKTPFRLALDARERKMRMRTRRPAWVSRGCKRGCQGTLHGHRVHVCVGGEGAGMRRGVGMRPVCVCTRRYMRGCVKV